MNYDYLCELLAIAQTGSLRNAAKRLGVSQPTLGRHIAALESELATTIVTRGVDGVQITSEGRYLLEQARTLQGIEDAVVRHFADSQLRSRERFIQIEGALNDRVEHALREAAASCEILGASCAVRFVHPEARDRGEVFACELPDIVVGFPTYEDLPEDGASHVIDLVDVPLVVRFDESDPRSGRASIDVASLAGATLSLPPGPSPLERSLLGSFVRMAAAQGNPVRTMGGRLGQAGGVATPQLLPASWIEAHRRSTHVVDVPVEDAELTLSALVASDDAILVEIVRRAKTALTDLRMKAAASGTSAVGRTHRLLAGRPIDAAAIETEREGGSIAPTAMRAVPIGADVVRGNALDPHADWESCVAGQTACGVVEVYPGSPDGCRGPRPDGDRPAAETTLMLLGETARQWIALGWASPVTPQQCAKLAKRYIDEGRVPFLAPYGKPEALALSKPRFIGQSPEVGWDASTRRASRCTPYRLAYDKTRCIGCGACGRVCPLGAIADDAGLPSASDACVACGHCVRACANHARWLVRADDATVESCGRPRPERSAPPSQPDTGAARGPEQEPGVR